MEKFSLIADVNAPRRRPKRKNLMMMKKNNDEPLSAK
jgi:hypothetical protein